LLRIRLARTGAKKKSSYRIVVIDRERARDGRFVEIVGHYNPRRNPAELSLKRERVDYWLGRGAQPSETVRSFLKKTADSPAASTPSIQTDRSPSPSSESQSQP
jgi:small subunit ribosomal protein S16